MLSCIVRQHSLCFNNLINVVEQKSIWSFRSAFTIKPRTVDVEILMSTSLVNKGKDQHTKPNQNSPVQTIKAGPNCI